MSLPTLDPYAPGMIWHHNIFLFKMKIKADLEDGCDLSKSAGSRWEVVGGPLALYAPGLI